MSEQLGAGLDIEGRTYLRASTQENLSSGFANNKGADQPAHPRSLISAYVVYWKVSYLNNTSEISIF